MNGNKMLGKNMDIVSLAEDLSKICAVLPNVPMQVIILDLMKLPRENRIDRFLRNYFKNNEVSDVEMDSIRIDAMKIRTIIPSYSEEKIVEDLTVMKNKQFRVQYVLKKYYDNETKTSKRSSEDATESPGKKQKTETASQPDFVILIDDNATETAPQVRQKSCVLKILRELFPDSQSTELMKICREYGYCATDIVSDDELTMFINQIMNNKYVDNDCCVQSCLDPQPSTSTFEFKQASSFSASQASGSSTEEYSFDPDIPNFIDVPADAPQIENNRNGNLDNEQPEPPRAVVAETSIENKPEENEAIKIVEADAKVDDVQWDNNSFFENLKSPPDIQGAERDDPDELIEIPDSYEYVKKKSKKAKKAKPNVLAVIDLIDSDSREDIVDSPVDRINEAELLKDTPYDANYDSDHFENDINFDELEAINEFVGYELNAQNPLNLSQENAMNRIGKVKEQNVAGTSLAKPKSDTRYRRLNAELTTFVKEQNVAGTSLAKPKSTIAYHLLNQVQNVAGTLLAKPVRQANGVEELEEQNVAGTSLAKPKKNPVYYQLLDMFPDIDPEYLTEFCSQRNVPVDEQISILLAVDYPKRNKPESPTAGLDPDNQMLLLEELFPDADPTFLQDNCDKYMNDPKKFSEFVTTTLEKKDYPTKEEYLKKQKLSTQEKKYTTEFSVEHFLEVIPDPIAHFSKNRSPLPSCSNENYYKWHNYKLMFFKNLYNHISVKDITSSSSYTLTALEIAEKLDNFSKVMKTRRKLVPLPSCSCIPLLQELAFIKHRSEILAYIEQKNEEKRNAFQIAKETGQLKTCECCYDEEVMPVDIIFCDNGHEFCKECVQRAAEVEIGQGKLDFPCLQNCEAKFSLQVLQMVLKPNVFSRMAQRKQLEEIKAAGIEDLAMCPFCDFATIPAPGDKVFRCLNEECMKESCLLCKEISHIPLRCNEVEKEHDVKTRTYIEDKMTEALVRKCYKCGMKFIKEGGCNKMTCSCGAMMCYICNKPVQGYQHFNGQGGDKFHLCPLYSDTIKMHAEAVKKGAEEAKKELGVDETELKIDPTHGIEEHYKDIKKRNPHNEVPLNANVVHPGYVNNHHHIQHNHQHNHRQVYH